MIFFAIINPSVGCREAKDFRPGCAEFPTAFS